MMRGGLFDDGLRWHVPAAAAACGDRFSLNTIYIYVVSNDIIISRRRNSWAVSSNEDEEEENGAQNEPNKIQSTRQEY